MDTGKLTKTKGGFSMWGMIISLISGILMSVQGVFNTEVTKQTSVWISAAFVQLTALIVCIAAWLVTGREGQIAGLMRVHPRYMLLGGVIAEALCEPPQEEPALPASPSASSVRFCPSCGEAVEEGARFCGSCGEPLFRYCASCGAENDISAMFCMECGEKMM